MSEVTSRVTAEGTVTIPEDLRTLVGLAPGSRVAFDRTEDGHIVMRKVDPEVAARVARYRGHAGPGMTTDEVLRLTRGRAPGDPFD
ncbi:AbrB/MazE/SpoVT family DNA-binding domain-containing protein [Salinarimonas chemoclinalis]|uniref:AbrB/MazE/SpoVT family DNA-binding domain-containing protein n=1 Tax=Salinarimonas chemoclinalis TaxID=3241599 RepID=UPI0035584934